MQLDDRDIICETDYSPLSGEELVTQIEWHAAAMSGASAYDLERITGPARALLARAAAAEAAREETADRLVFEMEQRETLAARAEAAERERDDANIEVALEQANAREAWERVAELEAERALLIADVCRVGKGTCPYCGIPLSDGGKCEECEWPRRYSLELKIAAKVFAAPPPDAPTEPTQ